MTYFDKPDVVAEAANVDIDTSEEDIVTVTDPQYLTDTQFSIYFDYDLGTNTSMKIRYYVLNEIGGSWYQLPVKNESTGLLTDVPSVIGTGSPASRVVEERPIPACFGFKVTGQGAGGANSSVTCKILNRNN